MGATSKIALGVAGGYVLGRTKKLKLALTLGGLLAGKRLASGPEGLLSHGSELVEKNPELARLQQDSGQLLEAVKAAALGRATQRLHTLGDTLRGHPQVSDLRPGESKEEDEAGAPESKEEDETEPGEPAQQAPAQKAASAPPPGAAQKRVGRAAQGRAGKPGQKSTPQSAQKATKKTAKKTAKKATGADRRSSGG